MGESNTNPKLCGKSSEELYKYFVCSAHLTPGDYNNNGRTKSLKWNAVPSLFLPGK